MSFVRPVSDLYKEEQDNRFHEHIDDVVNKSSENTDDLYVVILDTSELCSAKSLYGLVPAKNIVIAEHNPEIYYNMLNNNDLGFTIIFGNIEDVILNIPGKICGILADYQCTSLVSFQQLLKNVRDKLDAYAVLSTTFSGRTKFSNKWRCCDGSYNLYIKNTPCGRTHKKYTSYIYKHITYRLPNKKIKKINTSELYNTNGLYKRLGSGSMIYNIYIIS